MQAETFAAGGSGPLVTVVVPVFNGARFLTRALRSVEAERYDRLQVVVVDDGSTDTSHSLAAEFARLHSWQVLTQENQGVAGARNTGIVAAEGEFVTFLDADDEMLPDRIGFQVEYLASHPRIGVIIGTAATVLDNGVEPPRWLGDLLRPGKYPPYVLGSMMVRAHLFDRVGLLNTTYRVGEDTEWIARAMTAGVQVAFVDRVLVRRHIHEANLSHQIAERRNTLFRLFRDQAAKQRETRKLGDRD